MLMMCSALAAFLRMQTRDYAPNTPSRLAVKPLLRSSSGCLDQPFLIIGLLQDLPELAA